jgi:cytosine permease
MATEPLPAYLASAKPNPMSSRAPWYKTIAPSYFGIFMWIAFYDKLGSALQFGGLGAALVGLVAAALISHLLFYYVFGLLGMRTGLPLYVVGSSTFGTKGGYLFPGIFMGLLQIGWYSVGTYYATKLMLGAFHLERFDMTLLGPPGTQGVSYLFIGLAIAWGYIFATFGAFGIKYVAAISTYLPWIALAMLVIAFTAAAPHITAFKTPATAPSSLAAACMVVQLAIGFFATAGAAGVDFGTAARNEGDVSKGGLVGIALSTLVAGGLAILIVAGAQGLHASAGTGQAAPAFNIFSSLPVVSPKLASMMMLFLAIGSMAPACFCSSIIGNSLSTMIPSLPRVPLTLAGATIGIALAALGVAGRLESFFGLIGASFGPICGAMVADYLLSGRRWAGPRAGVNIAGYAAWVLGFLVGISNNPEITTRLLHGKALVADWQPTGVYSFVVAFIVYAVVSGAGLQPRTVSLPNAQAPAKV